MISLPIIKLFKIDLLRRVIQTSHIVKPIWDFRSCYLTKKTCEETKRMTPMLRQYFELKDQSLDSVLFFRMGDFYEVFGKDAEIIAPLLNIVLTSREKGDKTKIHFCGVPHHSARAYWIKLLKFNMKIAIADQVEDASLSKGLVKREITKYFSPGCVDDLEALSSSEPNYLIGIYQDPDSKMWALGLTDISTGEFRVGNTENLNKTIDFIAALNPKEILCRRFFIDSLKETISKNHPSLEDTLISSLPEQALRSSLSDEQKSSMKTNDFLNKICGASPLVSGMLDYFKQMKVSLSAFKKFMPLTDPEHIRLAPNVIKDLEIFQTLIRGQKKGSLFYETNSCLTPMGSRLLRWSLINPLQNKKTIELRHNLVGALVSLEEQEIMALREKITGTPDIERILTKLSCKTISTKELSLLRDGLKQIKTLHTLISSKPQILTIINQVFDFSMLLSGNNSADFLDKVLRTEVGIAGSGEVFSLSYDETLEKLIKASKDGDQKILDYQSLLRKDTKIASLKIKKHKSYGLLIEVTKTHISKVPDYFIKRQSMVNCERFITFDLQELDELINNSANLLVERESQLFCALLEKLEEGNPEMVKTASAIALFDMFLSFAWNAKRKKFCKPQLSSQEISLKKARHPSIEGVMGKHQFVPNDIYLHSSKKLMLITGPNMGGKSTVMRMVAVLAILNQSGSFIPAEAASFPVFDCLFTRVGASDDLAKGLSTFMVEMTETAQILNHASSNSLVILDEVGRGTSTQDGLAIASAVLESLTTEINCWGFFATHYHELIPIASHHKGIKLCKTGVTKKGKSVIFTHHLEEGSTTSSYGIDVAKIAGIPQRVLEKAEISLLRIKKNTDYKKHTSSPLSPNETLAKQEPCQHQEMLEQLNKLKIYKTTPLQALNILENFKNQLDGSVPKNKIHNGQLLF